jgi:hypothetical protein
VRSQLRLPDGSLPNVAVERTVVEMGTEVDLRRTKPMAPMSAAPMPPSTERARTHRQTFLRARRPVADLAHASDERTLFRLGHKVVPDLDAAWPDPPCRRELDRVLGCKVARDGGKSGDDGVRPGELEKEGLEVKAGCLSGSLVKHGLPGTRVRRESKQRVWLRGRAQGAAGSVVGRAQREWQDVSSS